MRRLLVFVIILMILMPTEVYADPIWDAIRESGEIIQDLTDRNADLQRRLNEAQARPQPTPAPQNPNIRLVQPQSILLTPGEVQYINIVVRNIGNASASNALVTAFADGPFSVEFLGNDNVLGTMAQNAQSTVRTRLTADANATAGFYSISVESAFRSARDGEPFTSNDTISVRIDAHARTPQVMLRDFTVNISQVSPGDTFTVSASLVNLGEGNAYGVQAAIAEGLDADGIFLSGSPNAPFLQVVEPGHSIPVSFTFTASERITSGTFPLMFEVRGRDHANELFSESFTYFAAVIAPQGGVSRAFISLSVSGPGSVIGVNGRAYVSVSVTNTGTVTANNIRVSARPADIEAIVPGGAPVQTIGSLAPGASQNLNFVFLPTSEAGSHYHTVGFEVYYHTGIADDTDTFEQFVGINVNNPNRLGGSRPRVLVSAYSVEPMIVSAGEEFDLYLRFQNTSSNRAVYNIRVTLNAVEYAEDSGAVFTTVGASNSIFVESLAPRQEYSHTIRMFTVPNADPRTYNIEVIFDYEDADFEEFEEVERLGINVQQVARLEMGNLHMPDFAMAFAPQFVDFNIINSGRVTLANLRVSMEGDFDTSRMDIFVGNIGRGNIAPFSGEFTAFEPGEHPGAIIISGEDEVGNLIEVRHDFVIFVDEMPAWDEDMMWDERMMMGDDDSQGESGIPTWMWIAGAVVIIAGGAGGFVLYRKKKKNQQDVFSDLQ